MSLHTHRAATAEPFTATAAVGKIPHTASRATQASPVPASSPPRLAFVAAISSLHRSWKRGRVASVSLAYRTDADGHTTARAHSIVARRTVTANGTHAVTRRRRIPLVPCFCQWLDNWHHHDDPPPTPTVERTTWCLRIYSVTLGGMWALPALLLLFRAVVTTAVVSSEKSALIALYRATNGPGWSQSQDWLNSSVPNGACGWHGVHCTPDNNHVMCVCPSAAVLLARVFGS